MLRAPPSAADASPKFPGVCSLSKQAAMPSTAQQMAIKAAQHCRGLHLHSHQRCIGSADAGLSQIADLLLLAATLPRMHRYKVCQHCPNRCLTSANGEGVGPLWLPKRHNHLLLLWPPPSAGQGGT